MANLSKEQFDAMKSELLVIYDQLKDLKRDASRKSRDFDFDASYVQRNEQTIDSLESRKKDLSASVEQKAKESVTLSEDSLNYFNDKIDDLTKQLEDKKFEFDGYNLTYSQNAFVSSVNQFADEIQSEFGSVKEKFDMNYKNSAMTDKYEDKDAKFEKQVNKMYEKFYDESNEIKDRKDMFTADLEQKRAELDESEAKHIADMSSLEDQLKAAEGAGNKELMEKINGEMKMSIDAFNTNRESIQRDVEKMTNELSYYTHKEAELNAEVDELVMEVREGIAQGRKFGGKVATIEEIYALGVTNFDSGTDLKDADAEVRAFKTDLEAFDQAATEEAEMFEDTFKKVLSDLGVQQAKIVKVEGDLKSLPDVIAENNDKVAMIQDKLVQLTQDEEDFSMEIVEIEAKLKKEKAELAGLPVDADPDLIAKYEAVIADYEQGIDFNKSGLDSIKGKTDDQNSQLAEATALIAQSQSELAEAQAIEGELKSNYDALKAEFNDSNIKRSQDVVAKEEQRKAKIDAIVAAEEAQSVADKFKAKFDLSQPAH